MTTERRLNEVILSITNRCNLRCAMCQIPEAGNREELNTEEVRRLLDDAIASLVQANIASLRKVIGLAAANGFPAGGHMTALTYYDAYTTARLPLNLLQAQRDYFGAHTYERIDKEGKFHTQWT